MTTIYVTHDQVEAMAVSDRLTVMDRGSIVRFAPPQSIYAAPANAFVARFFGGFSLVSGTAHNDRFAVHEDGKLLSFCNGPSRVNPL
ncbi:hypothetical protein PY650_15200 [Rhizobium calliandrae]|uniref:ABC transporter ATP-binding protein n=1 Tax=Rhizobium calliandrae TaxID=1312182 RepID=A0ABT7KG42_9HYPH|nr:hypothetical protein [Rhizobium calliandrae]MDL2406985.1 hypothetical protein [Rhizobium calliandrae]